MALERRTVAVLGGNAFSPGRGPLTMEGQMRFAHQAARQLLPLVEADGELLISHGNGPQVGHILTRVEAALPRSYALPLEVCVAESEGELGYVLEQALRNELAGAGRSRSIATLLTLVEVHADDDAFEDPDKPIGPFYTDREAEQLRRRGIEVRAQGRRGYRRVVASPRPQQVLSVEVIDHLLSCGTLVVAAGGGGIPVIRRDGRLEGVEAVIDKDRTAALLARQLQADLLLIVTNVPYAYLDYNTADPKPLRQLTPDDAQRRQAEGHFAAGSMGPKIEAAIDFVRARRKPAIICDAISLPAALAGEAGTRIEFP